MTTQTFVPTSELIQQTPCVRSLGQTQNQATVRELFEASACDPFEGGDGGDAGSIELPSIWLFGIEHGVERNIEKNPDVTHDERDYSIDKQLGYRFNRNAFKLFAAIHGEPVDRHEQFARLQQPWVKGSKGYLKGNLYPYPCRNIKTWTAEAKQDTGFEDKRELIKWCNEHRLPAIADAVRHYHPKLFIGVGASMAREFSKACFGDNTPLETHQLSINGHTKKIRYATHNGRILVVLPHISSGCNGLNSDESLQETGNFIAKLMR